MQKGILARKCCTLYIFSTDTYTDLHGGNEEIQEFSTNSFRDYGDLDYYLEFAEIEIGGVHKSREGKNKESKS